MCALKSVGGTFHDLAKGVDIIFEELVQSDRRWYASDTPRVDCAAPDRTNTILPFLAVFGLEAGQGWWGVRTRREMEQAPLCARDVERESRHSSGRCCVVVTG